MLTENKQLFRRVLSTLDPVIKQGERIDQACGPILLALAGEEDLSTEELEQVKASLKVRHPIAKS